MTMPRKSGQTILLFTEGRFVRDSTGNWQSDDGTQAPDTWEWYAGVLGAATIVGRCRRSVESVVQPQHPRISIVALQYYRGAVGLARRAPKLAADVWRATRDAVCIVRLPGVVGMLAAACCIVRRQPYAAEVVGDIEQVLHAGTFGRTGKLAGRAAAATCRIAVRRAFAVRYVTEAALQQAYPAARHAAVVAYSDVKLAACDFADGPRAGPGRPCVLIAVGSMEQLYKGHDTSVEALAILRRERAVDARLIIVGGGKYYPYIAELTSKLGVSDWVTLTGWIRDRASLFRLLDSADVFVMPSRTEGLPRALIEAMARGLPAIASDRGGIVELLPPAQLVPPDDPRALAARLTSMLEPPAYQAASEHGIEVARRYTDPQIDEQAAHWRDALRELSRAIAPGSSCEWP